jgi:hypothetical protein
MGWTESEQLAGRDLRGSGIGSCGEERTTDEAGHQGADSKVLLGGKAPRRSIGKRSSPRHESNGNLSSRLFTFPFPSSAPATSRPLPLIASNGHDVSNYVRLELLRFLYLV